MSEAFFASSEEQTREIGRHFAMLLKPADVVFIAGDLGAGKTTLVKGILEGFGFNGIVRSPTFNLMQVFPTTPPILHADLYRVESADGIGIEDYLADHLCLIEWADPLANIGIRASWNVKIEFEDDGRNISIQRGEPLTDS